MTNIIGIKQTSIDMYQMEQLRRAFPNALLLNGYDEVLLAGITSGANGGVGSTYNILGRDYLEMIECFKAGEMSNAADIQSCCNTVIDDLVKVGVFPGLKYLCHALGILETPVCRKPLPTLSNANSELDAIFKQIAVDEKGVLAP